jgi:hypothetical protein
MLVEAADEEDVSVRPAAVVALRALGRSGQEVAAKEIAGLSDQAIAALDRVAVILESLGKQVALADVTWGLTELAELAPSDGLRAGLCVLAIHPPRAVALSPSDFAVLGAELDIALPFCRSADARTASTASAVVCMLGRAAVADRAADASATSAPALLPLLGAKHDPVRWLAWRLLATGEPHDASTVKAIVAAHGALPPAPARARMTRLPDHVSVHRGVSRAALLTAGEPALSAILEAFPVTEEGAGEHVAACVRAGAHAQATAAWTAAVERSLEASHRFLESGPGPRRPSGWRARRRSPRPPPPTCRGSSRGSARWSGRARHCSPGTIGSSRMASPRTRWSLPHRTTVGTGSWPWPGWCCERRRPPCPRTCGSRPARSSDAACSCRDAPLAVRRRARSPTSGAVGP